MRLKQNIQTTEHMLTQKDLQTLISVQIHCCNGLSQCLQSITKKAGPAELTYFHHEFVCRLDPRLFKYCHEDASKHCHAPNNWYNRDDTTPDRGPMIFSCLYRHVKLYGKDPQRQVSLMVLV